MQDYVKLNYYQVMMFLFRIEELKKENEELKEDILVLDFSENAIERISEIDAVYGFLIPISILKKMKLHVMPKYYYYCLVDLTSINPINFRDYKYYKATIEKIDKEQGELMKEKINGHFNDKLENSNKYNIKKRKMK